MQGKSGTLSSLLKKGCDEKKTRIFEGFQKLHSGGGREPLFKDGSFFRVTIQSLPALCARYIAGRDAFLSFVLIGKRRKSIVEVVRSEGRQKQ